jgi:hypothetical protein
MALSGVIFKTTQIGAGLAKTVSTGVVFNFESFLKINMTPFIITKLSYFSKNDSK